MLMGSSFANSLSPLNISSNSQSVAIYSEQVCYAVTLMQLNPTKLAITLTVQQETVIFLTTYIHLCYISYSHCILGTLTSIVVAI